MRSLIIYLFAHINYAGKTVIFVRIRDEQECVHCLYCYDAKYSMVYSKLAENWDKLLLLGCIAVLHTYMRPIVTD